MYCPYCNQHVDSGNFCPECGTKLVEEPEARINLNLGRSNAIKGDINLSDSHNVHNEDKSVHNITNTTSTVNNVTNVAAQKKIQFMEKCKEVFADGILAGQENAALEIERIRLGLDPVIAKQLIEVARHSASFRMDALTPRDSMTLKLITNVLRSNDVNTIKHQLPRLEALSRAYAVDEVQYKYYLVLAALFPEKLVEKYEANNSDEYWKTFWVNIAYLKLGNVAKAEMAAMRLPLYKQYSDENGMLLAIISVLNEFGPEPAADYLGAIMGTYSQELRPLHHALALLIDPDKAKEMDVNKKACAFYQEYITTLESPEARAERLAKEKAEAEAAAAREREKAAAHVTYTLTLTGITDELKATMSARVFLGWATAQSRENFAKLPMAIKTTDNLDEAKTLYRKLMAGGMTIQTDAINGLNEKVDAKLGYDTEAENKYLDDALAGNAEAQYNLAECYYEGELGLEKDYAKAVEWYTKAAEQGHAQAQNNLGDCYDGGDGVAQDYSKAVEWYRKAAEQGNAVAQNNLGLCYEGGDGVAQDYSQAVEWYRKATEQGNAVAQNNLGYCYEEGKGVAQDYNKAVEWYRKAAEQGNADAQLNLGYCYQEGIGVTQDYSQAVEWYRKAAEQGNASAQNNLGFCYKDGKGVTQDYSQAVEWYRKAAEQGQADAQNELGCCYYGGNGVTQDYSQAVEWYRKAAEQGNAVAQYNLGHCYEEGKGVAQDYNKAVEWYSKAAEQGHAEAKAKTELKISNEIIMKYTTNGVFQIPYGITAITEGETNSGVRDIVKKIIFPKTIQKIGYKAFYGFGKVQRLELPDSVTEIGSCAFAGCAGLTSITIPDSVTEIGVRAFEGCTSLKSVTIPDSVTSIGKGAFKGCTGLTLVKFPSSVTSIGDWAFKGCTGLTSVKFPSSVTSIGHWAFEDCTGLTSVNIPDSVTEIGKGAFSGCSSLTSVDIPNPKTKVGESALNFSKKASKSTGFSLL